MSTLSASDQQELKILLSKPRIFGPLIKISFEIYHAVRPFHHKYDEHFPSFKRSAVFLFFVALRWYFFLKRLINNTNNDNMLNKPLSIREKLSLFIAICGHLLMIWAQKATLKHESESEDEQNINEQSINQQGPYSIIRHPHHLGKWISESFVAIYQNNKVSMAISILTLGFTINRANKEEAEYNKNNDNNEYQRYKRKVPNKLIPGIY